jgi:hypothetical protein
MEPLRKAALFVADKCTSAGATVLMLPVLPFQKFFTAGPGTVASKVEVAFALALVGLGLPLTGPVAAPFYIAGSLIEKGCGGRAD